MSFTETYCDPQRWTHFEFFATPGADGAIEEAVAPGKPWQFQELRVHASSAVASAGDLVCKVSSVQGSYHNLLFFSYAMLGSQDYWFQLSQPMQFLSDDQVIITFSMASAINVIGITAVGWAARG